MGKFLDKMERYFIKTSKNKYGMGFVLLCVLTLMITLTVLSIEQIFPVNDAYDVQLMGGFFSAWNTNVCRNMLVQFLSPFLFNFKVHAFDQDLGLLGCPWRERNSVLRLSFCTLILITVIWQLVIIITRNGQHHWTMLSWAHFLWFFLMSVMFVLDADGIYAGYEACINNFDVGGFGPIVLTLVGASFTTTLPPYFYSNPFFIPYQNEDSDTLIIEDFAITDGCHITPYIYTILTDVALMVFCYLTYRMSKLYDFEATKGDEFDDMDDDDEGCFAFLRKHSDDQKKNKKKQAKNSMAEHDGVQQAAMTTPVYPNMANIYETEIHGSNANPNNKGAGNGQTESILGMEPEHWNPRKPTYEQNFS